MEVSWADTCWQATYEHALVHFTNLELDHHAIWRSSGSFGVLSCGTRRVCNFFDYLILALLGKRHLQGFWAH